MGRLKSRRKGLIVAGLGVSVAVIDETGSILLQQREDFEVWGLPGGEIDPGESAAQAAIREVHEETGIQVELTRLVGLYALPSWQTFNSHNVVFAARPVGGTLIQNTHETIGAGFFPPERLPQPLLSWHRQRISDALNGVGGSVTYTQKMTWPFEAEVTRGELYRLRDQSGKSKQEFFIEFMRNNPLTDVLEVGDGGS